MRSRTMHAPSAWLRRLGAACACLLAGCAVGPDYVRPILPLASRFTELPVVTASSTVPGGAAQRFVTAQEVKHDWWTLFGSPALDTLVAKAFAANPTLDAARASLRVAQENVDAQRGLFFPTVRGSYSPARTKIAGNAGGNSPGFQGDGSVISTTTNTSTGGAAPFNAPVIYNFHTAQLTVGFVPDVFGANRRQVESLDAQTNYQRFELEAAYTTLASNVVGAVIQEALLRAQIASVEAIVVANTQSVDLVRRQWKAGFASHLDVSLQEGALAQSQQGLPPLHKQFEQTRNLLRVLAGEAPDLDLAASFELASLTLPEDLPLSLPSQVVEQRPDVRAAEEQLHAASALVGVATANRLPQFSIDGTLGGGASHFSQMFSSSGAFFNLAASLTQPIVDGGVLKHRQRAAQETLNQATAQYRATVLTAFQNVADTLHALAADADALHVAAEVERTAQTSRDLIRRQLGRGYVDRLALINAEQTLRQASLNVSQAHAARLSDTAALFQALGGGWQGSPTHLDDLSIPPDQH